MRRLTSVPAAVADGSSLNNLPRSASVFAMSANRVRPLACSPTPAAIGSLYSVNQTMNATNDENSEKAAPADPRVDLARGRTHMAGFRTQLALDRTMLAWMKTMLTLATFGFGMAGLWALFADRA
jgi:hypothetical protein